jgi:polysaccharide export outer membrane protein
MKNLSRILTVLLMGVGVTASLALGQDKVEQDKIVADGSKQPEASAAPATAASPVADKGFQTRRPRYKIEAGDAFEISFELNPEFNQTVTVQPDGFITLRGIGDVQVKGQTVPELTETLRGDYNKILNDPLISVVLKDFEKPYFIADGQVGHPGKYDLRGDVTLTEAVAMAGGFLDSAKHSRVMLYRRAADGWYQAETIDVKKMEHLGNLKEDPTLHAGDMVFVPKNTFSKVKVFIPSSSMGAFVPLTIP